MTTPEEAKARTYTMHGRRKGRRLRGIKSELMESLLPRIAIDVGVPIDPKTLFPKATETWLEVGFGGGEHLAEQAKANPSTLMIGCEPFVNGVASLLEHIHNGKIENIRIYPDDARLVMDQLQPASLSRCFVMFPDPWPKKRHASRRFIGPDNLPILARVMKPGAELRIASDEPVIQEWMYESLLGSPHFVPAPGTQNGIYESRPKDWPFTRYEKKSLAKKKYTDWKGPRYYAFLRKA